MKKPKYVFFSAKLVLIDGKPTIESNDKGRMAQLVWERLGEGYLKLTFEKDDKGRSNKQNAYYRAAVLSAILAESQRLGNEWDVTDCHDFLKRQFLQPRFLHDGYGNVIGELTPTTTNLTVEEFSAFVEECKRWAAETLEIDIP